MKNTMCIFYSFLAAVTIAAAAPLQDFTLASANGQKDFRLAEAKGKFVALHFLLKTECPICLRHTQEYFQKAAQLPGVTQVFIKPDAVADIQKWMASLPREEQSRHPIYRDPDARLAKALKIPDGYQFHGEKVHYPALVLLNPEGEEVFRYVGKKNTDRFSFEQLKLKITELQRK
jgi:thioredoxin-dependent peroxiredoxin